MLDLILILLLTSSLADCIVVVVFEVLGGGGVGETGRKRGKRGIVRLCVCGSACVRVCGCRRWGRIE